jgi:hypothetical protein
VSPFNFSERPIRLFQLLEEKEVIIANAIQQFIIYISINIYLIFIELLHQWIQFSSSFGSLSLTLFCVNLQSFERFQQNRSEFCIIRKIFFSSHIAVYSSPLYWKNPSILIFLFLFFFCIIEKRKISFFFGLLLLLHHFYYSLRNIFRIRNEITSCGVQGINNISHSIYSLTLIINTFLTGNHRVTSR